MVRKVLAQLASRMRDTFWQLPAVPVAAASGSAAPKGSSAARGEAAMAGAGPPENTARTEPPTHVVDAYQRGDFATVSEAIDAATTQIE